MKVVILAGGFGSRLSELTESIPKPMVPIGGHPILWHIMNLYSAHGYKDFIIALGYKSAVVKEYFLKYYSMDKDFTVDLSDGSIEYLQKSRLDWKVTLVDTGLNTMTGGRVARLRDHIGDETFMLTYGDGVARIDLRRLYDFHLNHGHLVTVTAVHPAARFGELEMKDQMVKSFKEKPQIHEGWINGGFFVCDPKFLNYIDGDTTVLEKEPLERAALAGELMAYKHEDFWQCMDTIRDRTLLDNLWTEGRAPWKCWE